jgi:serine protease Do
MQLLEQVQDAVARAAERVGPAVVGLGRGWGVGSGVVVAPGQVLTNAHAVRGDEPTVMLADGQSETGRLAGADQDLDIAVIEVDTGDAPAVRWNADGAAPPLGAPVVALANPGGRGLRATLGLVSSQGRSFRGPRGRRVAGAIEHTAPLPRGSSGGPLVDLDGGLIGINTVRVDGGLILALPATADVRERVTALAAGTVSSSPRLGVALAPPRVARRLRRAVGLPERDGLLVRAVEHGSPAERAGVEQGDLIVATGGRELSRIDGLYAALDGVRDGGELDLTVVRGSDERQVSAAFGRER